MDPVRVRLYGLFPMTRKRYVYQAGVGFFLFFLTLIAWLIFWPDLSGRFYKLKIKGPMGTIVSILNFAPVILLGTVILQAIEMRYVLGLFAKKEAEAQAKMKSKEAFIGSKDQTAAK